MRRILTVGIFLGLTSMIACGSESAAPDESDITQSCEATFTSWQKDAYMDVGGRNLPFWPPHTTTSLTVTCNGGKTKVGEKNMGNHGSVPGMPGTDGKPLLAAVKKEVVKGSKAKLTELLETYGECECAPAKFLGLNNINTPEIQKLIGELANIIETQVPCDGHSVELANALREGNIDAAMPLAKKCTWPGGDAGQSLNLALQKVAADNRGNFVDYHVCNNDATLQSNLIKTFREEGTAPRCDQNHALCRGPRWFYTP
ncbi:MAG: hypothetical protein U0174_14010 [Polyangiaceae bacterium]